jgi:hypothetical protein
MQRTVLSLAVPIGEPLRRASGLLEPADEHDGGIWSRRMVASVGRRVLSWSLRSKSRPMTASVDELDMQAVREHYLHRERVHSRLRRLLDDGVVHDFAQLALGIPDDAGNYSAAEHRLGPHILAESSEQDIFDLAKAIDDCPNPSHLPELIYRQRLPYLKISVGTEIAMMLKPNEYWVGNVRTIWAHLLQKHCGNERRANQELSLYRDGERDSEMDYQVWRDIYLALEHDLSELGRVASRAADDQGVDPGTLRFLWPDAVASFLYDTFAESRLPA